MPVTLPSYVAPNELIQSSWGNAVVNALAEANTDFVDKTGNHTMTGILTAVGFVASTGSVIINTVGEGVNLPAGEPSFNARATRKDYVDTADLLRVLKAGDTMTGTLLLNSSSGASLEIRKSGSVPYLDLQSDAGALLGRLSASTAGMVLDSQANLVFEATNIERARIEATAFLFGKTASDLNQEGVEIFVTGSSAIGSIRGTTEDASLQNLYCRHMGAADANAETFIDFARSSSGTLIGSVSQVSTTGVAYNTTSDERLKTVLRELDDDEIATILRLVAPVVFEFDEDPGNEHVGFIAQQLAATWPQFVDVGIVTVGYGEPGDVEELDESGAVVSRAFRPWMVDLSKLVPLLVAGWQQLDRRITELENN